MTQKLINIVRAEQVGDFRLRLTFDDMTDQLIDFQPFLSRSAHPDIRRWLSPEMFAAFRVEHGELVWGDYELCFPTVDLYRNRIDHGASLDRAA